MFCQECGAKNDDDAKHCKECGAKLSSQIAPKKEKNSFIKQHKKLCLCIGGILIIFVIFALLTGGNHTDVDPDLSSGIEKNLENHNYSVTDSIKDGVVKLSAMNLDLNDRSSNSAIIEILLYDNDISKALASQYDLSPREINGIEGYGGYTEKMYTYMYSDNGNTIVIIAPSKNSSILDIIVQDY